MNLEKLLVSSLTPCQYLFPLTFSSVCVVALSLSGTVGVHLAVWHLKGNRLVHLSSLCVCVWGEMCDFPLSHRVRACTSGAWISRPIWCSRSLWRLPALVPCDWEEFGGFVSCGPTAGDDCVTRHCCPTSFKDVFAPIWHAKRICWFKGVTADFCFLKATEIHVMASIVLENV